MVRLQTVVTLLLIALSCALAPASAAEKHPPAPTDPHQIADPLGANIGKDHGPAFSHAQTPGQPTLPEVAEQVTRTRSGLNMAWMLVCGFLVFFMQAGFALIETGFTRKKNASHTMLMNLMVFPIGVLAFYLCGFAFMFGGVNAFGSAFDQFGGSKLLDSGLTINGWHVLGTKGFFMNGLFDSQVLAVFLLQMVYLDTAATIPTGAMAERLKFSAFIWMSFFLCMVTYPLVGNWVWGGGWLAQLGERMGWGHGALDTAGSGAIHMVGGVTALVGAMVLGPRQGKYDREGRARPIPGHDIPMAMLGTLVLFFGWFGFNTGSVASAGSGVIAVAAVNTMLSGALGGFSAMMYMMYFHVARKPDPGICCNGILAGLVAITAPCAYVSPTAAVLIGIVAGALTTWSAEYVEQTLRVDDCVGAFAIHGVCGMWGVVALGLFACGQYGAGFNHVSKIMVNGKEWTGGALGLMPLGAPAGTPWGYSGQLIAQVIYAMVVFLFVFLIELAYFKFYDKRWGLRVSIDDEMQGLDIPETGCPAYADY